MVDIIYRCLAIYQLNEIFDNLDDICISKDSRIRVYVETELLVDTIASYIAQVITFFREEQLVYNVTGCIFIRRF